MVALKSQTLLSTTFSRDSISYLLPYPELRLEIALHLSRLFHFSEISGAIVLHPTKEFQLAANLFKATNKCPIGVDNET